MRSPVNTANGHILNPKPVADPDLKIRGGGRGAVIQTLR